MNDASKKYNDIIARLNEAQRILYGMSQPPTNDEVGIRAKISEAIDDCKRAVVNSRDLHTGSTRRQEELMRYPDLPYYDRLLQLVQDTAHAVALTPRTGMGMDDFLAIGDAAKQIEQTIPIIKKARRGYLQSPQWAREEYPPKTQYV